ncbi:mechanosensitive channel MscK [Thauera sp. Sel9]|uniref:mechanosensitive channel MscK n=1 Tax=Thauera sp. Sel9 TaxID=2974299 RepID=UPI0021E11E63|nr:mechanosensitive channel MscK [Thauera sp. Sel9]MCV2217624.1 mechanosensitive channel MscK [Thauera sp. Sel9]
MRHLRTLLCVLLLAPLLALAQPAPLPTTAELQARLDALPERKLSEADQLAAQQALQQALAHLTDAENSRHQLDALRKQLEQAPALIDNARNELARSQSQPASVAIAGNATLASLETRLTQARTRLAHWRTMLDQAGTPALRTAAERTQADIADMQARMQAIDAALRSGRDGGRSLGAEHRAALAAEWHALDARSALRLAELSGSGLLQDAAQAQRELAEFELGRIEHDMELVQSAINQRRRAEMLETVQQLNQADADTATGDGLIARATAGNQTLSAYLLRATEHLADLKQRNLDTQQRLDALNRSSTLIAEQIEVLQDSPLLPRILNEQRRALPSPQPDNALTHQIADVRLYQFEINKQREALSKPEAYADALLAAQEPAPDAAERDALRSLLRSRAELLERLSHELNAILSESVNLQLQQTRLQATAERLRTTVDEQLFWVPSNAPLDLDWLKRLPAALERQLAAMPWHATAIQLWEGLKTQPLVMLPVLLISVLLLLRRRWLRDTLERLNADIGYVRRDTQLHTPLAILLNLLLALPVSLLLAMAGLALQMDGRGQNLALGIGLMNMAQAWLVFYTAYRILEPGGVAERHFEWPSALTRKLHRRLRHLGLVVLAVVLVVAIAERQPEGLEHDVLGILTLLAGYAVMAWLMSRLLSHQRPSDSARSPLQLLGSLALALMPLALIVALMLGYYYTALKLTGRLIDTLLILIVWAITNATAIRGLAVAARRLEYKRAVERREAAEREAEGDSPAGVELAETPMIGIEQVNQQSLRLIRLGLLGALLGALYWVWADLITVFAYLDNITLYEYASGSGQATTLIPISLGDLLGALLIATLAFVLAGNLPGLLEVLVLSRMKLAQGSAYAITTLLSYIIGGIGIVATLGTLGVSWDKLQWLVAALSVGLGFGLQEIFANFISGLIILFERPVRIGDVVTIGNLSGTVSRIQIRATTITDFDRKEIIVPNKTFVTGQLVNWSLSDTVTRVTMAVGVAYGSDLELTRKLLLQAAQENPRVLDEPAPKAQFVAFGASTLDHQLSLHVREIGDRGAVVDEINRRIDALFREYGIEMAFNTVDVHVRSIDGKETQLETINHAAAASADADVGKTPGAQG